jgi:hypothetical protein
MVAMVQRKIKKKFNINKTKKEIMGKAVATPYIIAIILGIIVIAIIGYYFLVLGGTIGGSGQQVNCDAQKLAVCREWSTLGYRAEGPIFTKCSPSCFASISAEECATLLNQDPTKIDIFVPDVLCGSEEGGGGGQTLSCTQAGGSCYVQFCPAGRQRISGDCGAPDRVCCR